MEKNSEMQQGINSGKARDLLQRAIHCFSWSFRPQNGGLYISLHKGTVDTFYHLKASLHPAGPKRIRRCMPQCGVGGGNG